MSYALDANGLIFPTPYNDWSTDFINTLNPWIVQVSDVLANLTGVENVTCLSEITPCAGTVTSGYIGGWTINETSLYNTNMCLDNANERISVGNPAGLHIQIDGTNDRIRTSDFVSGSMGEGWQVATDLTEFQNIRARGTFTTAVFECQSVSAVGGSLAVMDSDVLCCDMTAADSQCVRICGNTSFAIDDRLRIKQGTNDEWFCVTAVDGNDYTVGRDMGASYAANDNPTWRAGTAVINYGACDEGGILMTSSELCSPYIDIFDHTGSPWSTINNRVRLGNLSGVSSSYFGVLSGYGLWAEKAYIEGEIQSCSIKLIDPACAENYSCLDAGALKYHDGLGDVPYVKRICSGVGCTGDTIVLNGWTVAPEVMVGINRLTSYDSSCAATQIFDADYSTPTWYCSSATCYGYCFDLCGSLTTSGSTCNVCVQNANFDACVLTYSPVCKSTVGMRFQVWCNPDGFGCYSAGCICYEICYRCNGCGTWQGSCSYTYLQSDSSEGSLKSDCTVYHDLGLPSAECWQLMATQTGASWIQTTIVSGTAVCCVCTRDITTLTNLSATACSTGSKECASCTVGISIAGSNPTNVYCNILCHCVCCASAACDNCNRVSVLSGTGSGYSNIWSDVRVCDTPVLYRCDCYNINGMSLDSCACRWFCVGSTDIGMTGENLTCIDVCSYSCVQVSVSGWSNAEITWRGGCLVQCWCYSATTADVVCSRKLYSTCDTTNALVTLDGNAQLQWLAISYS